MVSGQQLVGQCQPVLVGGPVRVQTDNHCLGDLTGASLPHLRDRLEVLLGVRRKQLTLPRTHEAGDHGPTQSVREGVVLDRLGPGVGLRLGEGTRCPGLGSLPAACRGVVSFEFCIDDRCRRRIGVDGTGGRQGVHDRPAQVGVDGETG